MKFQKIINWNLFIAFAAVLITIQSYFVLDFDINYYLIALIFFSTIFIYSIQRVRKAYFLKVQINKQQKWNQKNVIELLAGSVISLLLVVYSTFYLRRLTILVLIILLIITMLYAFLYQTKHNKPVNSITKPFIVAGVWTISTSFLPIFEADKIFSLQENLNLVSRFLFLLSLSIPFDIKDLEFDKTLKINTIPQIIGIRTTKILSQVILVFFISVVTFEYYLNFIETAILLIYLLSGITAIIIISKLSNKSSDKYYSIYLDGVMILQALPIIIYKGWA